MGGTVFTCDKPVEDDTVGVSLGVLSCAVLLSLVDLTDEFVCEVEDEFDS